MKETYYTLENSRLVRAKRIIKIGNRWVANPKAEQYAQIGAYPKDEATFTPPACDEGYHAVPDGYALTDGKWAKKWKVEPLPPPAPRTFSKLKITAVLMKLGKWIAVRDYLVQSGMYDLYLAAQDFREDDEFFVKGLSELKTKFGMSDEEVEDILKEGAV
jgi:hypothetical protein